MRISFFSLVIINIVIVFGFAACSSQPPIVVDGNALLNRISLGMTRAAVEKIVGAPISVQQRTSVVNGKAVVLELRAVYSPKFVVLEKQIVQNMQDNRDIQTSQGAVSGALSILGSFAPGARVASSVGKSAVGSAGELASTKIDAAALNPNSIESAEVVYRADAVVSIKRSNLSGMTR